MNSSSMGGGSDGGGFGGSGSNNSGGFGSGGRNSGAGGDRLDDIRYQNQQTKNAGMSQKEVDKLVQQKLDAQFKVNFGSYGGPTAVNIATSGKHSAENNFAAVTRAQYADWEKRFLPKQRELMALATDETLAKQQLGRTDGLIGNSLRQAQLGQDNQLARMGVSRQQNGNDHSTGLRQALMVAGTKNATRSHEKDRQMGILTGADAGTREKLQEGGL